MTRHGTVAALLAACLVSGPAYARVTATVVQWGQTQLGAPVPTETPVWSGVSRVMPVTSIDFLDHTDTVEGLLCRSFGLRVKLSSTTKAPLPDSIQVRVQHPRLQRPDGVSGVEEVYDTGVVDGVADGGFGFDEPWEIAPGSWTVRIVWQGEIVAEHSFTVTKPSDGAPLSDCPAALQS